MARLITTVGFDADDTLWHNERFFQLTQERFAELLAPYWEEGDLMAALTAAERRNIGHYGFGIKGFMLSMIETAIEVTQARVPATVIAELIRVGQEMLRHPIELLPHAEEVVRDVAQSHRIVLITKGDLLDQERKLAQSGLGELFHGVEIVSDKRRAVYERIFAVQGDGAARAMMVGNSMKSDVVPMVEAGGWGVYVPHGTVWALEHADPPHSPKFAELMDLSALPELFADLD
jgi:putative hydrolase of the HAD superfamily